MDEVWESTFAKHDLIWGEAPTVSSVATAKRFAAGGRSRVLIPGVGYGRNALPFLERGMSVSGIEVSKTAIDLARSKLNLSFPIHHGSVEKMPFDDEPFDGIYCYGLLYLLDQPGRAKLLRDCFAQLARGGEMTFVVISKDAPIYGNGTRIGQDWYETHPGMRLYFYDEAAIRRDFGEYGLTEVLHVDETAGGTTFPFLVARCLRP